MLLDLEWQVLITEDGMVIEAIRQACPVFPDSPVFACDFGFFASGSDRHILTVELETSAAVISKQLVLEPQATECGARLTMLKILADADGNLAFSEPVAFDPCAAL